MQRGLVGSEMCIRDRSKLRDTNQAGKKNLSSAAYNPITLEYDPTDSGIKLKQQDDMSKYRAQLRSHNIDSKSNCGYNLLTGETRVGVVATKPDFLGGKPEPRPFQSLPCLLYTSDAADDTPCVDLGGRRIIKKKKNNEKRAHRTDSNMYISEQTQNRTLRQCR
eukprot:TRINITY_DN4952_c0_g1_i6.p1 TRINITY_DN4952_c0_g1~~TRINITY_DN4952_c0_g1_i6.p1  ORF type:complete len:164 (-),score=29.82 TRINITY_DN4952_c0_g1_i6:32-523(-)